MDNFKRGDNALAALRATGAYEDPENTLDVMIPTPDGGEAPGHDGYPISDLIADLFHLTRRFGLDPEAMVTEAWEQFGADIVEQAHMNDDNWDNLLQTEANAERAREVLRINSVPEAHWDGIFRKTGLDRPEDHGEDA